MIIQLCGMSGAGKTTLSKTVQQKLLAEGVSIEIIDGDEYRKTLCRDLGFSREDRHENVMRMAFVAAQLARHGIVSIIAAINPFEATRSAVATAYAGVKTVYLDCSLETLVQRDTKGLYKRALLPDGHPDKIGNLTGVNDPFEPPANPDLYLNTSSATKDECATQLTQFIRKHRQEFRQANALRELSQFMEV